jgi:hypothetical protein
VKQNTGVLCFKEEKEEQKKKIIHNKVQDEVEKKCV